jgi:CxxC-x17-CxxC domain-containing protein
MSNFQDRTVACNDCGSTFIFTAGEQAFYQERGFSDPKRCPDCRAARKAQRSSGGYQSAGQAGRSRGFGGGERRSGRERPQRRMYDIICDDCGQPAQVPFSPRDDRPVYCKECYQARQ